MSLTIDLQPAPAELLVASTACALVLDTSSSTAGELAGSAVVQLDEVGRGSSITLDVALDEIVATSLVGASIVVDAAASGSTSAAPGALAVVVLDVDGCSGPPGPTGPPGSSGTSPSFRFSQSAPSASWVIDHPLGYRPAVTTTDTAGSQIVGDVVYVDDARVRIDFARPIAGFANLS